MIREPVVNIPGLLFIVMLSITIIWVPTKFKASPHKLFSM